MRGMWLTTPARDIDVQLKLAVEKSDAASVRSLLSRGAAANAVVTGASVFARVCDPVVAHALLKAGASRLAALSMENVLCSPAILRAVLEHMPASEVAELRVPSRCASRRFSGATGAALPVFDGTRSASVPLVVRLMQEAAARTQPGSDILPQIEAGITMLLDAEAPVDARDTRGRTALAFAMAHPCLTSIVKLLASRGADPFALDSEGVPAVAFVASAVVNTDWQTGKVLSSSERTQPVLAAPVRAALAAACEGVRLAAWSRRQIAVRARVERRRQRR